MKNKGQFISTNALLATALGLGSVGAAMYSVTGAVIGTLVGLGVGYWAEITSSESSKDHQPNKGKKVHA